MNARYTLLTVSLLSTLSILTYATNDLSYCKELNDIGYVNIASRLHRIETTDKNIQAALAYLLAGQIPDKYNCSFNPRGRIQKICIKNVINNNITKDSLDITIDLPDSAQIPVLTTDQILEIGYVTAQDLLAKKSFTETTLDAGKTLVREKLVEAVLWLLEQTHLENLLPDTITNSYVYEQTVHELARFYMDALIKRLTK